MKLEDIYRLTGLDEKTLQERALKLGEESGELAQAVLSATGAPGSSYKQLSLGDVREEAADAAIVALSLFSQTCDSEEQFRDELERLFSQKMAKWEEVLSRS